MERGVRNALDVLHMEGTVVSEAHLAVAEV
jgi:hypothetical protein